MIRELPLLLLFDVEKEAIFVAVTGSNNNNILK